MGALRHIHRQGLLFMDIIQHLDQRSCSALSSIVRVADMFHVLYGDHKVYFRIYHAVVPVR